MQFSILTGDIENGRLLGSADRISDLAFDQVIMEATVDMIQD